MPLPTRRYYANTDGGTTLSNSINSAVTSIAVANAGSFPSSTPFTAVIEHGTANMEVVLVTNVASNILTVVRGYDNTTAVSHGSGVAIRSEVVALDLSEASQHTSSSIGVHGVAGNLVGDTDVQTLTNKTLTSPSVSNPTVTGTATGANATLSGTLAVSGATTVAAVTASGAVTANGAGTGLAVTNNATVGGTAAVTGAHTAASYSANGNGTVTGVLAPKNYTNEAAAGTQPAGNVVYLTAPTGVGSWGLAFVAGLFRSLGGGTWVPLQTDPVASGSGWTIPTLGNSWVSFDSGATFANPSYSKSYGVVWLQGLIKNGTGAATIFTLPAGFRPAKSVQFLTASGTGAAKVRIDNAGNVSVVSYVTGGSNADVSLNGIQFNAEA